MLTKEAILGAEDRRSPVPVSVPEWKIETAYLLELTGDELDMLDQLKSDMMWPEDEEAADWRGVRSLVVSLHLCDENGKRFDFTDMERRTLGSKSGKALDRLYRKCQEISGLTKQAVEDAEKNLPRGQTDSSG